MFFFELCVKHIFQHENAKPEFDLANARDIYHNAPLHVAAEKGHLECVKTLFSNKGSGTFENKIQILNICPFCILVKFLNLKSET